MTDAAPRRPAWSMADVIRESGVEFLRSARRPHRFAATGIGRPGPVPHRGAGRSRPSLPRLRPRPHRLQLVPQPPLPDVPGLSPRRWLEREAKFLLPVEYFHVVFTLPAPISALAYYNTAVLYDLLFAVAAETLRTIAADPKHLGAQVGVTLVLHT